MSARTLSMDVDAAWRVLDALLKPIAVLDASLTIRFCNQAWRAAYGEGEAAGLGPGAAYLDGQSPVFGPGAADAEALRIGLRGERCERAASLEVQGKTRWFSTVVAPYSVGGQRFLLLQKLDVTEERRSAEALRRYHATLDAVGFAASQFLSVEGIEQGIDAALRRLGEATDVSRVYIFDMVPGEGGEWLASQRYEWVAEGIKPEIDNPELQNMPFLALGMGRWASHLSRGEPIHGLVKTFPQGERDILEPQDILSIAVVSIFVDGAFWGFMGFDECRSMRVWSSAEIDGLRAAAGLFGAAIQHQQSMVARERSLFQEQIIKLQEKALLDLSAPLIPVHEHVVVMPLIGVMNAERLGRVLEALLDGIAARRARVAILDMTGVQRLEGDAAFAFVRVTKALGLIGAEVRLSGLSPESARALVEMGADWKAIATHGTLQAAIAEALRSVRKG